MRVPLRPAGAVASMKPWPISIFAPSASKPLRCRSMGRVPMAQPPGSEIFAWPQRARSGPMMRKDARILRTRSYGASQLPIVRASTRSWCAAASNCACTPRRQSTSVIVVTSSSAGTSSSTLSVPWPRSVAAMIGSTAFFAPLIFTRPWSRRPPWIISFSIYVRVSP